MSRNEDPCTGCRSLTREGQCRKMANVDGNLSPRASLYFPREDCPGREVAHVPPPRPATSFGPLFAGMA